MNKTELKCKQILTENGIDIFSDIDFDINGEVLTLSFGYIIDTFMKASDESQLVFLIALEKSIKTEESAGVERFFEGMGQLLLMTHLSNKIEV
jgi:hypothetical protein